MTSTPSDPWRPELIATDLDGTLVRSDGTISTRTSAVLAAAREQGARHVIVTGRSLFGCRGVIAAIGYTGLVVASQGAMVYDAGSERVLTTVTLDRAVARAVLLRLTAALGERASFAVLTAEPPGTALLTAGYDHAAFLVPTRQVSSTDEFWAEPILKLYVQHPDYSDEALTEVARRECGVLANVEHAAARLIEVIPAGMSKAIGLSLAARRLGVTADATVAFGDMPNDIPMLRWARLGVAVGNAHPTLRAEADETAPSNDADGVATVLERWFPVPVARG